MREKSLHSNNINYNGKWWIYLGAGIQATRAVDLFGCWDARYEGRDFCFFSAVTHTKQCLAQGDIK